MKTSCCFLRLAFWVLFLVAAQASHAQAPAPAALPGYWNLETNLTTRAYTIVRFYDGHDQLVYEERLPRLCLDLGKGSRRCRQRTSQQLTQALQLALHDPAHAARATAWLTQQLGHDPRETRLYAVR
ncbi:hypothetical protein [Hymenobacter cheonanensis]|uniref:hypothetical protein n=1 Tax=Hymenobacter sp. CA2-7 TaxID=3063993 RepID=UPI0027127223|nr:hypothetical protein [Hymenobacter sp. CA2-7]MDO7887657.1 hypothetical protein [Hymenobacter sp. CA2-7]